MAGVQGIRDVQITYTGIPPAGHQRVGRIGGVYLWSTFAGQEDWIVEVDVIRGMETPAPAGWQKLDASLSPQADPDKALFLAVRRAPPPASPLLGLSITTGVVPPPEGFRKLESNLNTEEAAGAEPAFLCISTKETQQAKRRDWAVGEQLDCLDSVNAWCPAQVVDMDNDRYHIHFTGWSDKWNEWIPKDSPRLAEFRRHTHEGQLVGPEANRNAWMYNQHAQEFVAVADRLEPIAQLAADPRTLELSAEDRAFLLGENHTMLCNNVLNAVVDDPKAIALIVRYLEMNLQLAVFWLRQPGPIPKEVLVGLNHIFNAQEKEARFYLKYGCSVNDKSAKGRFAARPKPPPDAVAMQHKCESVYFVHVLNHFGDLGGYDLIAKRFTGQPPESFETVSTVLMAISTRGVGRSRGPNARPSEDILLPKFVKTWLKQLNLTELVQQTIVGIDDESLKNLQVDVFDQFLQEMAILVRMHNREDLYYLEFLERMQVVAVTRQLACSKLATRLAGAKKLLTLIACTQARDTPDPRSLVRATDWLTSDWLVQWIQEHRLLEAFIAPGSHEQMIGRATRLMVFLSEKGVLGREHIDLLWSNVDGAHESLLRMVYSTVADLSAGLPQDMLLLIAAKIYAVPFRAYTDFFLDFVQKFTVGAARATPSGAAAAAATAASSKEWFGLDIFWQLEQESSDAPEALAERSHQKLVEMLRNPLFTQARMHYIETAVCGVLKGHSPVQCWRLIEAVVKMFPAQGNSQNIAQAEVLQSIQLHFDVLRLFMLDLRRYNDQVNRLIRGAAGGAQADADPVVGIRFRHSTQIETRLRFLDFLLAGGGVELNQQHLQDLWHVFVTHPVNLSDRVRFFQWLMRVIGGDQMVTASSALSPPVLDYTFKTLLSGPQSPDFATLTQEGFKCMRVFFARLNLARSKLMATSPHWRGLYVSDPDLEGLEAFWRLLCVAEDPKVSASAGLFLTHLHTSLEPRLPVRRVYKQFLESVTQLLEQCVVALKMNSQQQAAPEVQPALQDPVVAKRAVLNLIRSVEQFLAAVQEDAGDKRREIQRAEAQQRAFYCTTDECEKDAQFPRIFLSNQESTFQLIFELLGLDQEIAEAAWRLLDNMPTNHALALRLRNVDEHQPDWPSVFPSENTFSLLYRLQIIDTARRQVTEASAPNMVEGLQRWQAVFMRTQGPRHLAELFMRMVNEHGACRPDGSLPLARPLLCKSATLLLDFVQHAIAEGGQSVVQSLAVPELVTAMVSVLHTFAAQSLEDPPPEASPAGEGADACAAPPPPSVSQLVGTVLRLGATLCRLDPAAHQQLIAAPHWREIISLGLVHNASAALRIRLREGLLTLVRACPQQAASGTPAAVGSGSDPLAPAPVDQELVEQAARSARQWTSFLLEHARTVFSQIQPQDAGCAEFFTLFRELLLLSQEAELGARAFGQELLERLQSHPVAERRAADTDAVLVGLLQTTAALARVSSAVKRELGAALINEVFHAVFDVPTKPVARGEPIPPKAKSERSRREAFAVLLELSQGCPENLAAVVRLCLQNHLVSHSGGENPGQWMFESKNEEKSATGYVGMRNLGCICYLNSLIQQLYMIPTLRQNLLQTWEVVKDDLNREDDVLYQLLNIMGFLQESEKMYADPTGFCLSFKDWEGQPINVKVQKDSGGFLSELFDKLDERLKNTEYAEAVKSVIGGVLSNQLIGLGDSCPHYRERDEPFYSLTIPVKNKATVEESLAAFCEGEALVGDNAFKCPKCDKKVDTLKRVCIKQLPPTICFNLKRFELNYETLETSKLNSELNFPTRINLRPYTKEGLPTDAKVAEKIRQAEEEQAGEGKQPELEQPGDLPDSHYQYVLRGVVVHSGTAGGGHYYSYVQERLPEDPDQPDRGWLPGRWVELNDHLAVPFDSRRIPEECFGGSEVVSVASPINNYGVSSGRQNVVRDKTRSGYLLFYDRVALTSGAAEEAKQAESAGSSPVSSPRAAAAGSASGRRHMLLPPARVPVPQDMLERIWRQNTVFFRDRAVFDLHYFEFLWRLVSQAYPGPLAVEAEVAAAAAAAAPAADVDAPAVAEPEAKHDVQPHKPEQAQEEDPLFVQVVQLGVQFFMETLSRSTHQNVDEFGLVEWTEWLEVALGRSKVASRWFLQQMARPSQPRRPSWNEQFLLRCHEASTRGYVVSLVTAALRSLAQTEATQLSKILREEPAEDPDQAKQAVQLLLPVGPEEVAAAAAGQWSLAAPATSQYAESLLQHLGSLPQYWQFYDQYFEALYQFAQLGSRHVRFLLKHNLIAKLVDLFLGDRSPLPNITPNLKLDAQGKRPPQGNAYASPELQHFLRLLRVLVCSSTTPVLGRQGLPNAPADQSPFPPTRHTFPDLEAIQELVPLSPEALQMLQNEAWLSSILLMGTTRQRGQNISAIMCHLSWHDELFSQRLVTLISQGIEDNCWDLVRPYFRVILALAELEDPLQPRRVEWILSSLLTVMELQQRFWKITDFCIEHLVRLCKSSPACATWMCLHGRKLDWMLNWLAIFHQMPRRDTDQIVRYKPQRDRQLEASPWVLPSRPVGMRTEAKIRAIEALQQQRPMVNDYMSDSDEDLNGRQFRVGQWVDAFNSRSRRVSWTRAQVLRVGAGRIKVRFWGWPATYDSWFSAGSSNVASLGQHTKKGVPQAGEPRDD